MTEAIKGTRPLVPKNHVDGMRQVTDPNIPFENLAPHRPVSASRESRDPSQQGQMPFKEALSGRFADQLKDAGTVTAATQQLRYLQEVISLISLKADGISSELFQIQKALFLAPEQLLSEIKAQSALPSRFRGTAFEPLLLILHEKGGPDSQVGQAIAEVLRALNQPFVNREIGKALMSNLQVLNRQLKSSTHFSEAFKALAQRVGEMSSEADFKDFKFSLNQWCQKLQNSVLFNGPLARQIELLFYNLSRINYSQDLMETSLDQLRLVLENRSLDAAVLKDFQYANSSEQSSERGDSVVLQGISDLLSHEGLKQVYSAIDPDIQEKLLHTLMDSIFCHSPLIHLVLPLDDGTGRSYGEAWIEYRQEEQSEKETKPEQARLLLVMDLEGTGPLEAEIQWQRGQLSIDLYCQERFIELFKQVGPALAQGLQDKEMHVGHLRVMPLQRKRALLEIFPDMARGRRGIDVRI